LMWCFILLVQLGVLLLLFDLLLYFSYWMWCSTPLVWPTIPLLLLDLLFHSFCSTYYSSCSTCCSAFLAWPIVPFLLFDLLFRFSCATCYFTPLTQLLFCSSCSTSCLSTFLLHLWFPCSFCSTLLFLFLLFQISISLPLLFCNHGVWRSCPNLNSWGQTWKVKIFVFNSCC
jgi:hypothetical protein